MKLLLSGFAYNAIRPVPILLRDQGAMVKSIIAGILSGLMTLSWNAKACAETLPAEPKIVTLDWTATAMVISLGITPVGVADTAPYRVWVKEPALPANVQDVGLRDTPNPEIIARLKPDLILVSPLAGASHAMMAKIAPTRVLSLYGAKTDPLDRAAEQLAALGQSLGRSQQANTVITQYGEKLENLKDRLGAHARPPLLLIQFVDGRFIRIYGSSSLFGSTLKRLGLNNAWTGDVNDWGYTLVGLEQLAAYPDADIVVIDPLPANVSLGANPESLWGNLPNLRNGRVLHLAAAWPFGEFQASERFADLLVNRLTD